MPRQLSMRLRLQVAQFAEDLALEELAVHTTGCLGVHCSALGSKQRTKIRACWTCFTE